MAVSIADIRSVERDETLLPSLGWNVLPCGIIFPTVAA